MIRLSTILNKLERKVNFNMASREVEDRKTTCLSCDTASRRAQDVLDEL